MSIHQEARPDEAKQSARWTLRPPVELRDFLRQRVAQELPGLSGPLREFGLRAHAELRGDGLGFGEGLLGGCGVAREEFDLSPLAQELAQLRLVNATNLGFALHKERSGLVEGALMGADEGEGAAKGAGRQRPDLVANADGI